MKTIRVVAAVMKSGNEAGEDIVFATARGYGEFKGGWEFPGGKGWLAVREGPWKGLVQNVRGGAPMKLYNLDDDPREDNDLAARHPEIVELMWKRIEASHGPVPSKNPKFELDISYP